MATKTLNITLEEGIAARIERLGVAKVLQMGLYQLEYRKTMNGRNKILKQMGRAMQEGNLDAVENLRAELAVTYRSE